jgi:acetoin utilization deacetylase AcuC-like enzyme
MEFYSDTSTAPSPTNAGRLTSLNDSKFLGDSPFHEIARQGDIERAQSHLLQILKSHGKSAVSQTLLLCNNLNETPFDVAGLIGLKNRIEFRQFLSDFVKTHKIPISFKTLLLHHPDTLLHAQHSSSPSSSQGGLIWEGPDRIIEVFKKLYASTNELPFNVQASFNFPEISEETILRCHSMEYWYFLNELTNELKDKPNLPVAFTPAIQRDFLKFSQDQCKANEDSDSSFNSHTLRAAILAASSACHAVDQVFQNNSRNALCLIRPPGHHAGVDGPVQGCTGCGFSILNSVAIAAFHAAMNKGKKVAIIDFDSHHGNGTEDILKRRGLPDKILFVSTHLYDSVYFPSSGETDFESQGIFNIPIKPMWDKTSKIYTRNQTKPQIEAIEGRVTELLENFKPDIILLSAGFDAAAGDLGNLSLETGKQGSDLSPRDFGTMTRLVMRLANKLCNGRVVSVLEGGYGSFKCGFDQNISNGKRKRCVKIDRTVFVNSLLAHFEQLHK